MTYFADINNAIPWLGSFLLISAIVVPWVCALIAFFATGAARALAILGGIWVGLAGLGCWLLYAGGTGDGGYQFGVSYPLGLEALGISLKLGLNGIAAPLFMMAGVVGAGALLYAAQMKVERQSQLIALLLIMQGGLMGIFASVDIFFFYFFHEVALIPTFIMIGIWGGSDRRYVAMELTIYLMVGSMLSLIGLILLYVTSGAETFDLVALREALAAQPIGETWQQYGFGLLLFGFGILVSLFPFHTWAPRGYAAAPAPTAMLHAGILKKFGLYGLIQIGAPLLPTGAIAWQEVLLWLALGNVLIIGLITMAQRDLKYMLGYASVMHMGYAFLGIATLGVTGLGGAVFMMFAHGLSIALLFLLADAIMRRAGTSEMTEIGGLLRYTPVLGGFFAAGILASIGLPGFANFWGELAIFVSLWNFDPAFCIAAVLGIIISAVYGLRAVSRIFMGEPTSIFAKHVARETPRDLMLGERIPIIVLLAMLFLVGFWPRSISDGINQSLEAQSAEVAPAMPTVQSADLDGKEVADAR